jgi:O-antigen/teichoic acid export membrane protein
MLRRLFQQSGVYTLASIAGKASGFVVALFYIDPQYLPKADFGYFGGLRAVMMIALLVAGAGLPLGILRFATSREVPEDDRTAVPATALLIAVVASSVVALLGWIGAPALARWIVEDASRAGLVRTLALYVAFKTVADVSYQELRRRERAGLYVALTAAEMLLQTVAVVVLLVGFGRGLAGILEGYLASAAVLAVVSTAVLVSRVERRVSWPLIRPMIAFGVPLVVSGLAGRFLYVGDRFLILHFLGPEENAVYEWAAQFGGLVNAFLVQSFQLAFTVLGLKALDDGGAPALHRRAFRHFSVVAGFAVLGLALFVDDASRLVTPDPAYADVSGLVLLIGGGLGWYGLYFVTVNVLFAAGRTRAVAVAVGAAAVLNAGLNWALIPWFGIAGSAAATFVAYAALAVWTGATAERISRAGYPWRVPVLLSLLVAGLWALALPTDAWPLAGRLAARLGLLALFVPGLLALGVYGRADVDAGRGAVRAFRVRRAGGSTEGPSGGGAR